MVLCHGCHIYWIWTSRSKKLWWILKSHNQGVVIQVTKGGLFIGKAGSHYVICCIVKCNMLYCKSYWVYTVKDFIGCLFSPYYCCFMCLRLANKAKSATQSVLMALKLNGLFQKNFQVFQVFYSPENYISLTLSPFPFCLFFPLQCLYYNF